MRHPPIVTIRAALSGVAFFFAGLAAEPALADPAPIAPAAEMPALDLFVDSLVAGYGAAQVCLKPGSPGLNPEVWAAAKAKLVATLWANGFSADFVHSVASRLDAAKPATGIDCKPLADVMTAADTNGFESEVVTTLGGAGLAVVNTPVSAENWQQIEAAIAAELPPQKRMLECIAVAMPDMLPMMVHDWDVMLGKIGTHLVAAGLDRDEISKQLAAAEANALWQRAAANDEPSLKQSCAADHGWLERFSQFQFGGLADAVDKLLPASIAEADP